MQVSTPTRTLSASLFVALVTAAAVFAGSSSGAAGPAADVPLKDAKLNIEHNATDKDTGFQGFVDSEGWQQLDVTGPDGQVLSFEGLGTLGELGMTELFFETVEPENADVPISEMLAKLPAGNYEISGPGVENGKDTGQTSGTALLTHDIPKGPKLLAPEDGAKVEPRGLVTDWRRVRRTITGDRVRIIAYQLIIEKDVEPRRHMIGKFGLSMYLPRSVTRMRVPTGFLQPDTKYNWEVLAIERSGNQTLSSGAFKTRQR